MNLRCELWDGGEQFGTGTIHAFIVEGVDSVAVIELDGSGFLERATLSCCKIIKPDAAPAKPAQDLAAAIPEGDALDSALYDAMAEQLSDLYYCGRVWSAWGVGTMTEDDFGIASEDEDIVANFVNAALSVIHPAALVAAHLNGTP